MPIEIVDDLDTPETIVTEEVLTPAEVIVETPVVETVEDLSLTPLQNIVTKTIKSDVAVYDEALFHTAIFYKALNVVETGVQDTIAINNSQQGHVAYILSVAAFNALKNNASKTYPVVPKSLTWAKNSSRVFSKTVKPSVIFALQTRAVVANVGQAGQKTWTPTTVAYLVNPAIYADLLAP